MSTKPGFLSLFVQQLVFLCVIYNITQWGPPKVLRSHLQNPTVQIPTVYSVSDPMSFSDVSAMD